MAQKTRKQVFEGLGIWPTAEVLSFFTLNEQIEISRVNKEAHYICKKVFAMRLVDLEKVNIRTVKMFRKAEKLRIRHSALEFFSKFKDELFIEILEHYRGLNKFIVNLKDLFSEKQKDQLLERLASFTLGPKIKTLIIEESMLNVRNLEAITRT